MKLIYDSKTISQIFNMLNSLLIQGLQNNQIIVNVSTLLQQNEVELEENEDVKDNLDSDK